MVKGEAKERRGGVGGGEIDDGKGGREPEGGGGKGQWGPSVLARLRGNQTADHPSFYLRSVEGKSSLSGSPDVWT